MGGQEKAKRSLKDWKQQHRIFNSKQGNVKRNLIIRI
jgi:hypothetical protein